MRKGIEGKLVLLPPEGDGGEPGWVERGGEAVDVEKSRLEVESLKKWLAGRGVESSFFFPAATGAPDYLDPQHPRYAHKLAAAVSAWLAVGDPKGKSPKQALEKWLRDHSAEFNLSDEEGKLNELGISECSKVANWKPEGGAPKTPHK